MEIVNIEKRNAIIAYNKADEKGKSLLVNLFGSELFNQKITDRIKTFEDAVFELGIKTPNFDGDSKDEIAYKKLKIIVKALNQNWTPDWNNHNKSKYNPIFTMGSSGSGFSSSCYGYWNSDSGVGSRLCFEKREVSDYAAVQFKDIYKDFLTI